jgi:hypothetical protein
LWSKIGYKTQDIDLKNYRDNHLFTKQENACQVNLYPLGRANQHEWPDHYENLFGISSSKDDKKLYTKEVRMKRIPKIKEIWDDYAKVTVCIGKKRWEEFTKLFKLEGKTPIIKTFGKRTSNHKMWLDFRNLAGC